MIVAELSNSVNVTQRNINIDFATAEEYGAAQEWHELAVAPPVFEEGEPDIPVAVSPAFRFGYDDARNGEAFAPECYFASDDRKMSYTLGFLSVRPDCTPALAMYMELVPDQRDDVEYAERAGAECMAADTPMYADDTAKADWRELSKDILNEKGIRS